LIMNRRIVIEVDGYQKNGQGPTPSDVERRNRRDSALQARGYRVLHFSNAQVRQEPDACRQQLERAIHAADETSKPVGPVGDDEARRSALRSTQGANQSQGAATTESSRNTRLVIIGAALLGVVIAIASVAILSAGTSTPTSKSETSPSEDTGDFAQPINGQCPPSFPVKGNDADSGERIFHVVGQQFYERTYAEICFRTPAGAESAGYRASER
jgi:hypothetical protein